MRDTKDRYSRQVLFPQIGNNGQDKIASKHVLVLGVGALGSSIAEMLVRSGIGKLTLIDRDYVEYSNLQRQQLYSESDALQKLPKVIAAKNRLQEIHIDANIEAILIDATVERLEEILPNVDLIMDATDNFETRMVLNDLSQKHRIPWIYGACVGSVGMSFTIIPGVTPCLNCLMRSIPMQGMTCDTGGIISPAVQMTVAHQVAEAMKILVDDIDALRPSYVYFDLWRNQYETIKVGKVKKDSCLSCGNEPTYPFLEEEQSTKTSVLCGRDTVQIRPRKKMVLNFNKLSRQLDRIGYKVSANPFLLSAEKDGNRIVFFKDGRAMVHGCKDVSVAKTLYQKILG
ncbi:MAG: thiamine/molybdopterin biosynthesis ThiF/MoeB-like protein [Bacillales bacterium]|jgi:adenylyltransferase/sulfurtransferase|nr:thiamine/molybdopterin biosynthesis ThiF/MoeB-like protein [Bacillales bacterium]